MPSLNRHSLPHLCLLVKMNGKSGTKPVSRRLQLQLAPANKEGTLNSRDRPTCTIYQRKSVWRGERSCRLNNIQNTPRLLPLLHLLQNLAEGSRLPHLLKNAPAGTQRRSLIPPRLAPGRRDRVVRPCRLLLNSMMYPQRKTIMMSRSHRSRLSHHLWKVLHSRKW